jgi:SAM-dependent methyltransferase
MGIVPISPISSSTLDDDAWKPRGHLLAILGMHAKHTRLNLRLQGCDKSCNPESLEEWDRGNAPKTDPGLNPPKEDVANLVGSSGYAHRDQYSRAEAYEAMFSWDPTAEVEYIISIEKKQSSIDAKSSIFLDIGCGTDRIARKLSWHVGSVICLDISLEMLLIGRNSSRAMSINADMLAMPLRNNSIDIAYSLLATINHLNSLSDLAKHISEAYRVLRDCGV